MPADRAIAAATRQESMVRILRRAKRRSMPPNRTDQDIWAQAPARRKLVASFATSGASKSVLKSANIPSQFGATGQLDNRMGENRLIIHAGAPKCGSSSLQTILSRDREFRSSSGNVFRYAAITDHGNLAIGEDIRHIREGRIEGLARSADLDDLQRLGKPEVARLVQALNSCLKAANIVLSCEGWLARADEFADLGLLAGIETPVDVVAYVRPQADYLNANWWQWGAWNPATFQQWIYLTAFSECAWGSHGRKWMAMAGVSSVHMRLRPADIITDFFGWLSCDAPPATTVNRSLPGVALRFLQRHRDLRPDAHASAIDFVLERALKCDFGPTPWVLPIAHVTHVIQEYLSDNLALLDLLSASDRARMLADPHWWSPSAYQDRTVQTPEPCPPDGEEMDAFAAELARALMELEQEHAALRARIGVCP